MLGLGCKPPYSHFKPPGEKSKEKKETTNAWTYPFGWVKVILTLDSSAAKQTE